jgi:hypothetical protein
MRICCETNICICICILCTCTLNTNIYTKYIICMYCTQSIYECTIHVQYKHVYCTHSASSTYSTSRCTENVHRKLEDYILTPPPVKVTRSVGSSKEGTRWGNMYFPPALQPLYIPHLPEYIQYVAQSIKLPLHLLTPLYISLHPYPKLLPPILC